MSRLIQNNKEDTTKIMRISYETYSKLREFSRKKHDIPTSYDDLIIELVDFYNSEKQKEETNKYFNFSRI
jgi:hypothetical protein